MKFLERADTADLAASFTSAPIHLETMEGYSICASLADTTPTTGDTFVSGVLEVQTLTFPAQASVTDRDYIVVYDQAGTSYAVYADKTGTSIAPTGAAYVAATYKVKANISADTTAASVAASFETAFNTLTGFTTAITSDDGAANGTMLLTQTVRGPTTNPVPKTFNDSGSGSLVGVQTTGGVASAVDLTANTATISDASDYWTGLKVRLTTTTTLPTGLSAGVDYYIIAASATTVKFASSLVNAGNGTAIDLTGYGAGTATIVITDTLTGTLKLQASNNAFADNTGNQLNADAVWVDIPGSSIAVATSATQIWNVSDVYYKSVRVVWTHTVNGGNYTAIVYAKSTY